MKLMQQKNPKMLVMPSHYSYFQLMISALKKIGVGKGDKVILCLEGHSWRKDYYAPYKANRAGHREDAKLIDWDYHYKKIGEINDQLDKSTDWHVLRFPEFGEADDIQAVACRAFPNDTCVVVTIDKDLFMLAHYDNVRIFSLNLKCKGSKGIYEKIDEPLKILASKAQKGDVSDNIIPSTTDTKEDYELRKFIIDLFNLPDFVEKPIRKVLENLPKKTVKPDLLPFQNSLAKRFFDIYKIDNVITPEYCYALQAKRDAKKKKKIKLKREEAKLKKQKEKENGK